MKKRITALLCLTMMAVIMLTGCKKEAPKSTQEETTTIKEVTYDSATQILDIIWNEFSDDEKFPINGESSTKVETTEADVLSSTLLIPAELQSQVKDAASIIHMMNANTFTGAAVKVDGDKAAFITALKDAVLNNRFMCGFPEKLVIVSVGDYVAYSFGADEFTSKFEAAATEKLEGAKVEASQLFE